MPARKSKTGAKGKAAGGTKRKGVGAGPKPKATQTVKSPNRPPQATSPKPAATNPSSIPISLYRGRPLQRPIAFVPGVHTRVLFSCEHEEEAKVVQLQVKEEVVHVENVDDFSGGLGHEVYEGELLSPSPPAFARLSVFNTLPPL